MLCSQNKVKSRLESLVLDQITEILAPLHFSCVVLFNCIGPNAGQFYHLDRLSEAKLNDIMVLMLGTDANLSAFRLI